MSKLIVAIASLTAVIVFAGYLWFGKDSEPDKVADVKQEKVAQAEPDRVDQTPVVAQLDESCTTMLWNEELYKKYKVQSYETIAQGEGPWFFRTHTDFVKNFYFDAKAIKAFKMATEALKARGVTLVIAYIPPKGIAQADAVTPELAKRMEFDSAAALASYKKAIADVRAQGIHIVGIDTFEADKPFYLKADQHWTQHGADRMAQAVATYVKTLPVYKDLPKQKFETQIKSTMSYQGKYNEAMRKICGVTAANETDPQAVTTPVGGNTSEEAMFGDQPEPQAVLVGTSNSKRDEDSNFGGALKEHLETDVTNAAIPGVGYDDPLMILLSSQEFKKSPPKLIVWEIPGYYDFDGSKDLYNIMIANIWGNCDDSSVEARKAIGLQEGDVTLFDEGAGDKVEDDSYLVLTFDKPVKKKFSVSSYAGRTNNERVKFDVSKRAGDRVSFLTDFSKEGATRITLKAPKELAGTTVNARLCRKPAI